MGIGAGGVAGEGAGGGVAGAGGGAGSGEEGCGSVFDMTTSSFVPNAQLALEEMRLQMERVLNAGDALDQKANFLLGGAGLAVALVGALLPNIAQGGGVFRFSFLIVAAVLYFIMVLAVLRAMLPARFVGPISADWNTLKTFVLEEPIDQAFANVLVGYTTRIEENKQVNLQKASALKLGAGLFPFVLLALIISAAI